MAHIPKADESMFDSRHDKEVGEDGTEDNVERALSISSKNSDEELPSFAPPPYHQSPEISSYQGPVPDIAINPSTIFTIQARGFHGFRRCRAGNGLDIYVFSGTDTTAEPIYVSSRAKRSSGSSVLRHSHKGPLLSTTYKFGPGREPEIRHVENSNESKFVQDDAEGSQAIQVKSHSYCFSKRVATLATNDQSDTFEWAYFKTQTSDGKRRVLALSMKAAGASKSDPGKLLAVLVRTDSTRTAGTTKSDAGNGGQLLIDFEATAYMDESLIIATCIMMLKKEIDRRRAMQAGIIVAAVSGGVAGAA